MAVAGARRAGPSSSLPTTSSRPWRRWGSASAACGLRTASGMTTRSRSYRACARIRAIWTSSSAWRALETRPPCRSLVSSSDRLLGAERPKYTSDVHSHLLSHLRVSHAKRDGELRTQPAGLEGSQPEHSGEPAAWPSSEMVSCVATNATSHSHGPRSRRATTYIHVQYFDTVAERDLAVLAKLLPPPVGCRRGV